MAKYSKRRVLLLIGKSLTSVHALSSSLDRKRVYYEHPNVLHLEKW